MPWLVINVFHLLKSSVFDTGAASSGLNQHDGPQIRPWRRSSSASFCNASRGQTGIGHPAQTLPAQCLLLRTAAATCRMGALIPPDQHTRRRGIGLPATAAVRWIDPADRVLTDVGYAAIRQQRPG